uniref:Transmembrane protein 77 n=1 Tax=Schistosoma japonicum TaxID=6182 RepID=C1L5E3_SCHJA|nr:Transmembrane protein 77 [Schistosoma japonicum]
MSSAPVHYFIIAFIVAIVGTFCISYLISTSDNHASILFPYISDTGALPPESCIFGQLLNICSFLCFVCVYCWYLHECSVIRARHGPYSHIIFSRVTCIVGCLCSSGMSMVANFQEASLIVVHLIGAIMTFNLGVIFAALVTFSTRKHLDYNFRIYIFRIILTIFGFLANVGVFIFGRLSGGLSGPFPRKWDPSEPGYTYHAMSSFCEWLMSFIFLLFFFSMIFELKNYVLHSVKVQHRYISTGNNEQTPLLA